MRYRTYNERKDGNIQTKMDFSFFKAEKSHLFLLKNLVNDKYKREIETER